MFPLRSPGLTINRRQISTASNFPQIYVSLAVKGAVPVVHTEWYFSHPESIYQAQQDKEKVSTREDEEYDLT